MERTRQQYEQVSHNNNILHQHLVLIIPRQVSVLNSTVVSAKPVSKPLEMLHKCFSDSAQNSKKELIFLTQSGTKYIPLYLHLVLIWLQLQEQLTSAQRELAASKNTNTEIQMKLEQQTSELRTQLRTLSSELTDARINVEQLQAESQRLQGIHTSLRW